jgi:hypothetical protein
VNVTAILHDIGELGGARNAENVPDFETRLRRLKTVARVMDTVLVVPGTNLRFGADALLGLIPGAGDLIGAAISLGASASRQWHSESFVRSTTLGAAISLSTVNSSLTTKICKRLSLAALPKLKMPRTCSRRAALAEPVAQHAPGQQHIRRVLEKPVKRYLVRRSERDRQGAGPAA